MFTNGGSESDNLAIKGLAHLHKGGHIITTCIEHSAVRGSCDYLKGEGYAVTCLPVDRVGCVDPDAIEAAIQDDTFLITVMWANNETGQIQPVEEIARIARDHKIAFHTDAVQAFGKIPVNVKRVPVDLLSISGHKFYAPKGVGALYIRSGIELIPEIHGGGQEMGLRSGTENIACIAAMGEACRLAVLDVEEEGERLSRLRDMLESELLARVPDVHVSGDPVRRVPNTSNIMFEGIEAGALIKRLDEDGIAVSGASACSSGKGEPSVVLMMGMGLSRDEAAGAIRFSLGRYTKESDITQLFETLPDHVKSLRMASSRR